MAIMNEAKAAVVYGKNGIAAEGTNPAGEATSISRTPSNKPAPNFFQISRNQRQVSMGIDRVSFGFLMSCSFESTIRVLGGEPPSQQDAQPHEA